MFIPVRTEMEAHRTPLANYALIAINVLLFAGASLPAGPGHAGEAFQRFVLNGARPALYEYVTYQFAHADGWHLAGNMLFLWVFGNSVNAKMRNLPYLAFYLAGGAFAALGFRMFGGGLLLGASGSIAAVTTAYLVLFPRSRVTVLYVFFFIGFFDVPATLLIGLKIVLWDNILAPSIGGGEGQVAYSVHLAGYAFGFVVAFLLLVVRVIPRDHFDMLAMVKRWRRRQEYAAMVDEASAATKGGFGRVVRARRVEAGRGGEGGVPLDQTTDLRARIADALRRHEPAEAAALYERLVALDSTQCLPAAQQMEIGRHFYSTVRFPQAAAAFERYLGRYSSGSDADDVRLLLGIVLARDLRQYEAAERYLQAVLRSVSNPARREQAERWLAQVRTARGPNPTPQS